MYSDLIYEIIVAPYPSRVKLSEKQRAKYYKRKDKKKIPKKYQDDEYGFDDKGFFVIKRTGEKVIANPRAAGTPRYWSVNFQAIWNQQIKYQARANVTQKLKDVFRPYIEKLDPIEDFPIRVELFIFDTEMTVDVDNKGVIYTKVITDLLVNTNKNEDDNKKIIPDDSPGFVNDTGRCKFVQVDNKEDSKMIIKIWKSNNSPF